MEIERCVFKITGHTGMTNMEKVSCFSKMVEMIGSISSLELYHGSTELSALVSSGGSQSLSIHPLKETIEDIHFRTYGSNDDLYRLCLKKQINKCHHKEEIYLNQTFFVVPYSKKNTPPFLNMVIYSSPNKDFEEMVYKEKEVEKDFLDNIGGEKRTKLIQHLKSMGY